MIFSNTDIYLFKKRFQLSIFGARDPFNVKYYLANWYLCKNKYDCCFSNDMVY